MRKYPLTPALYEKLLSRGMHLVCRKCELPIRPHKIINQTGRKAYTEIVSKPSKYRQWQCIHCKYKFGKHKPLDIDKCPMCETEGPIRVTSTGRRKIEPIINDMGRKFYCSSCYESTVHIVVNDAVSAGMVMLFGI